MSFKVSIENLSHQFRRTQKVLSKDLAPLSTLHGAPESDPLAYHNSLQSDIQKIQNLLRILENSTSIERDILISLEARINDSMNESV